MGSSSRGPSAPNKKNAAARKAAAALSAKTAADSASALSRRFAGIMITPSGTPYRDGPEFEAAQDSFFPVHPGLDDARQNLGDPDDAGGCDPDADDLEYDLEYGESSDDDSDS